MPRVLIGWFFILHAFAHASIGVWSSDRGGLGPGTAWWLIVFLAYMGAGLGLLRMPHLRRWWKQLALVGIGASISMVAWFQPPMGTPGVFIDVALLLTALTVLQPRIDADISVVEHLGADSYRHPHLVATGWAVGIIAVAYSAAVVLARPANLRWGTTPAERVAVLPGDDVHPANATYRIDHAITIHAPADAVWPWLVQLGQDRGGFYSYDWLERMVGDHIRNADRIHPEWQRRGVGDTVLATQRSYLGGRLGTLGWRVTTLDSARVLGLEQWGTFVLQPIDSAQTRLIVRTRNARTTGIGPFLLAPLDVFVFEPAHFIMERGMLRGIRDRAERATPAAG